MTLSPTRATFTGLSAILLWSTTVGLLRSISEAFGAIGGAALVYTTTALLLCLTRGLPRMRDLPRVYLWGGGALFVAYEISLALAIGLASNRSQSLELGMINYLWPCLTILFAIPLNQQHFRFWLWPGILLSLLGIVWVMKGEAPWSPALLWQNIRSNPIAYGLAFFAAIAWGLYNNLTRRYAAGKSGVNLFFLFTALVLWIKFAFSASLSELHFAPLPLMQVLFMGASTAIAYSAWNQGIQHGNLTLLATASYFTPVLSALLGALWLSLSPGFAFWQGVAMITLGSLICWHATRQR